MNSIPLLFVLILGSVSSGYAFDQVAENSDSEKDHLIKDDTVDIEVTNNMTLDVYTKFKSMPDNGSVTFALDESIDCIIQPHYRYLPDGQPGRELNLVFRKIELVGKVDAKLEYGKKTIGYTLDPKEGIDTCSIILPADIGVHTDDEIRLSLNGKKINLSKTIKIPKKRQWTVYLYPHSHVDIGYTNTQENCEIIHTRNLVYGAQLSEQTVDYPEGARYIWNPEVLWPVERYLSKASVEEKEILIEGVKKGYLHLDAGYAGVMTSAFSDEELIEYFRFKRAYEKLTGVPIETLVQVDIPGMTWGMVPMASKLGIKYVLSFNNGYDRVGRSVMHSFKPFWWYDASGKNKLLFLQAGSYNPGALIKGHQFWPSMAGQTDPEKLMHVVKTNNPRNNFIDSYINKVLPELEGSDYYPYDIFVMSWAMADNTPIDADLPDAVKSWNEEYAYPRLVIASATDIFRDFEQKYGDQLPVLKGDFTEYWTDGLGTASRHAAMNRSTKERLVQAETIWTMLKPETPKPQDKFNEAWRNVLLGTEHTWCYMAPGQQPLSNNILKVKHGYFETAKDMSQDLLSEALASVVSGESVSIGVFNTLSWQRSGMVTIEAKQCKGYSSVFDDRGDQVLSQILSTGDMVFLAENIPAFGSALYHLSKKKNTTEGKLASGNTIDNGVIRMVVDPATGDIASLINAGQEYVNQLATCAVNSYRYLHGDDGPDKATGTENVRISIIENGPLLARMVVESGAEGCDALYREISLYRGQPYMEIKNTLDKQAIIDKEGVHFGFAFDLNDPAVVADIPWGTMELEKDQLEGANRNWMVAQRWINLSDDKKSITWCSLDAPVFEVNDITANIVGSASGSDQWISKLKPNGTLYSWALNNHWHTNFQLSQDGEIVFRYRIRLSGPNENLALANRYATEQFQPLLAVPVSRSYNPAQVLSIDGDPAVTASVFKTSPGGRSAILRLKSISSKDETIRLIWHDGKPSSIRIYDLKENIGKTEVGNEVVVPARDFISLEIEW